MGHWCQRPRIPSGEPGSSGSGALLNRLPRRMAVKVDGRARQNAKELSSNLHILSAVVDVVNDIMNTTRKKSDFPESLGLHSAVFKVKMGKKIS